MFMRYTVAKVASRAGVPAETVRYYERRGLLPPADRSSSGYRLYDDHTVERLRFIRGAQHVGLKLRQIGELLELTDDGACPCGRTERLVDERIAEIEREVMQLQDLHGRLVALRRELGARSNAQLSTEPWPCEATFMDAGAAIERGTA